MFIFKNLLELTLEERKKFNMQLSKGKNEMDKMDISIHICTSYLPCMISTPKE